MVEVVAESPLRIANKERRPSIEGMICLLSVVVRTRDCKESEVGRYEATRSVRSETLDASGSEKETVDGSDRPGKVDSKTFTFDGVIFVVVVMMMGGRMVNR